MSTLNDHVWNFDRVEGKTLLFRSYEFGCFSVSAVYVDSGCLIARGMARTAQQSLQIAKDLAAERLIRKRTFELTVGG